MKNVQYGRRETDIQQDMAALYKNENVAGKLAQPKRHFAWFTKVDVFFLGVIVGYILYFIWHYYF